jgi:uncharacterized protein
MDRRFPVRPAGWGLCLALVACEPRVEEPPPPTHDRSVASQSTIASAAPTQAASAASPAPSCVEEMPSVPSRTPRIGPDPGCPTDPLEEPPELGHATVRFEAAGAPQLDVEVAERDRDRQRGLMYRTELAPSTGMLFVFGRPRVNRFWMRNTCISLDMLFIDDAGLIVGVAESTPTLSDEGFSVRCKSKYVLEVPGGFCRQHGIRPGQRVDIDGL